MKSMTGYAARDAEARRWELRAVNGRGLDLRLRLPDSPPGLEPMAREVLGKSLSRGNVTLSLRLGAEGGSRALPGVDPDALASALDGVDRVQQAAQARGLSLAPTSAAQILGLRGLWDVRDDTSGPELGELKAELLELVAEFDAARAAEGAALGQILSGHIDEIAALIDEAQACLPDRARANEAAFRAAIDRLADAQIDEARVVQEIATMAVRADVAEELDRLRAHVTAARGLIAASGPVGRKLDFLTQEFNREANTLCAKSGHAGLTAAGLELKTVIDRLREQVQNVE